ncbi:unnamed protein product [Allacma fusca]|uniref:Uncharacterized protein n=1 Tax=Allacma fusca TaxID=39272 RepID=A0A8J2KPW6_9HEXA|nr:unnamed protein product [Allacma fusca]
MDSGDQNCTEKFQMELDQVCTSTPVASTKHDYAKRPILDELDVSMIFQMSDRESPIPNHLNITPSLPFNPDSYSELFTEDFITAWNQTVNKPSNRETFLQFASAENYDTIVEAKIDLNGCDCPCAYGSKITDQPDGLLTMTAEETDVIPAMAAIAIHNQQKNLFQGMKDLILGGVKKLVMLSTKTFGIQNPSFKSSVKECKDAKKDNFNDTMKPMIEVCNVYVTLKTAVERRIYKCLYLLTAREFRDFLTMENAIQNQECFISKDSEGSTGSEGQVFDTKKKELARRMKLMSQQLLYLRQYLVLPNLIQSVVEHSQNEERELNSSNSFLVFSPQYESAKLERMYHELELIKLNSEGNRMDKVVIVTQFQCALEPVKDQLWSRDFFAEIISDDMTAMEHQLVISEFSVDPNGPDILIFMVPTLLRTKWNMEGVRHLFILDNHWDPSMELEIYEQICNNNKPVTIKRFITRETVEEAIDEIRESKLLQLNEMELQDPSYYHNLSRAEIFRLFGIINKY